MAETIDRLIQFFRVRNLVGQHDDIIFHDTWDALESALQVPLRDSDPVRYLDIGGGDALAVFEIPFPFGEEQRAVRFCRLRSSAIPEIERRDAFQGLPMQDDANLAEPIHIVVFDNGVVGADFNRDGPRTSQLRHYLLNRAGDEFPPLSFEPLVRGDVHGLLDDLDDLRFMRFEVHPDYARVVSQFDGGLTDAVRAQRNVLVQRPVAIIEARMRTRREREGALNVAKTGILAMIDRPDFFDYVSTLKFKGKNGYTGRSEEIDILGDRIVTRRAFVK